jgi:hypothetical protein
MFDTNMKLPKNTFLITIMLTIVSVYLTLYTLKTHSVASQHVYEDPNSNIVTWRTGPGGSLFPWPKEPGMLEVLSEINVVDLFIYRYFIKSWALAALSILIWVATSLSIFRALKQSSTSK